MSDFAINDENTITIYREPVQYLHEHTDEVRITSSEWPDFSSDAQDSFNDLFMLGCRDTLNSLYGFYGSKIVKVIENKDAVIVFWRDKTKTVVKRMAGDNNDIYSAVAQALAKKIFGSTTHFHKIVDKCHVVQKERAKYHGE